LTGRIGLPERDYYIRTGEKDETVRKQYIEHVAKMLTLAGTPAEQAQKDATAIMAFETALAKASRPVTDRRDPRRSTISRQSRRLSRPSRGFLQWVSPGYTLARAQRAE
jgi:predicted metalloendopeptidase